MTPLFLAPYFEKQRELDQIILDKFNLERNEWLYERLVLAFQVELMECCNSWRGFKFWSEKPEPKEDLLEEYVDGLHFIFSLGITLEEDKLVITSFPSNINVGNVAPLTLFALCADVAAKMHHDNYYNELIKVFLDLGYVLGFTWEQITEAYNLKYETNIQRQKDGY